MYEATSSVQAGSREIDWAENPHHKKAKTQRTFPGLKDHCTRTKILTNVPIGGAIRFAFTEHVLAMADGLGDNFATERVSIFQTGYHVL
ncbi:hypothetical protein [Cryobacterium sp. M91]|uniref:hypothetical protein n=1 Tax=Cryobacterium sp. M91 TaxID=2048294 RepID=UPI0011B04CD1|nr:hypothetical protein [Cryobacterium sp. M91]